MLQTWNSPDSTLCMCTVIVGKHTWISIVLGFAPPFCYHLCRAAGMMVLAVIPKYLGSPNYGRAHMRTRRPKSQSASANESIT